MEKKENLLPLDRDFKFELKTTNNFVVELPEQFDIKSWTVVSSNKPKFTNGEWEDIKIVFNDYLACSTSQGLFNMVNFLKTSTGKNKFQIKLKSLDPTGVVVEQWVINVKNVLTINFGELDHRTSSYQKLTLIVKPLNCILEF